MQRHPSALWCCGKAVAAIGRDYRGRFGYPGDKTAGPEETYG